MLICERFLRWNALDAHKVIFLRKQVSVRPIRLQQAFHTKWFMVEGQVVEHRIDVIYSSAPMNVERWNPFFKREADRGGAFISLSLAGERQIVQRCGGKSKRKLPRCWRWAKIGLVQNLHCLIHLLFCRNKAKRSNVSSYS